MNPLRLLSLLSLLALLVPLSTPLLGQSFVPNLGDWNVAANWNPVGVPSGTAVVTGGRVAFVQNAVATNPTVVRIGNNPDGGTLRMDSGSLTANNLQAATAAGSTGHFILNGGTLTAISSTFLSATTAGTPTPTGTSSSLTISGGTLNWGTGLNLGLTGTTLVTVTGNTATLSGTNLNANAGTTFRFNPTDLGSSAFTGPGALTITDGAALIIDGSLLTGPLASTTLFQFASISGSFANPVTFQNFGSLIPSLNITDTTVSLQVIPEPSTAALLTGLLALGLVIARRRR